MNDYSEMHARMKKRNRATGLALAALVIFIAVVSFYKIEVMSP